MDKVVRNTEFGETSDLRRAKVWTEQEEEALNPLEKFRDEFDGHKIEISKEQILDNQRRQEDELLALEAIYQDNLQIFDKQDGLLVFQISLYCDVTEGFKVSAKFHLGTGTDDKSDADLAREENSDEGFFYSFEVQFLPPIVLTCMLPKSYPSHDHPFFTIDTQWFHESKLSSICTVLDSIWTAQLGQEVIFQWAEWLHSSSLSYLGFDDELDLTVPHLEASNTSDTRAIFKTYIPDRIIPLMIRYNEEKCHENFLNNIHKCAICLSEYLGLQFIKLPCEHLFCLHCMETYSRIHVKEGSVTKLSCPSTKCGAHVPPFVLKRLLDHQEYERWESLLLQRTLDAMSDVVYCPRCDTACVEDSEAKDAQCSKCFFSFCTLCKDRRHVGEKCQDPEIRLRILEKELMESGQQATKEQIRKEEELTNAVKSLKLIIFSGAKQCPRCRMAIFHTEGCNKMTCTNCGQYFCFRCGNGISGYDHFKGRCDLFPREEIVRWEQQMLAIDRRPKQVAQAASELFGEAIHPCPRCHTHNPKVANNNHLVCRSCELMYCALCYKGFVSAARHFSRKGCRKHTADP